MMESSFTVVFGLLTVCLCMCAYAQNETQSEGESSAETNRSCANSATNKTDYVCELNSTDLTVSTEVVTEGVNGTTSIADVNSTLSSEVVQIGNETYSELPVNATTAKPEIQTTRHPETTTEPVPATVETVAELRPVSSEICVCDIKVNSCDINCCCDVDCSDSDRLAFSGCHGRAPFNFDPRHCYHTHFIYHNNTELKLVQDEGGLFCIVSDNLPARFTYQNRRVVTTLHEFNKLHRSRRTFSWQAEKFDRPSFDPSAPFRKGAIIWTVVNRTLIPFSLPVHVTSALCQASKIIYYLSDWSGTCHVVTGDAAACENRPELSASTFYKGFTVLVAPELMNETYVVHLKEDCPSNVCIAVTLHLCSELSTEASVLDHCDEVTDLQPSFYDSGSENCLNVVREVRYMIYHNGTKGITNVCVYVWLTNVTLYMELSQKFSVSFRWTKDGKPFHRSGNPGYIVGKPVMTGKKVTQVSGIEGEVDKEAIEVDENPEEWLSIAVAKKDGRCDMEGKNGNSLRQTVTFGENRWSSCMVFVSPSNFTSPSACATMHKATINLLAGGVMENVTSAKEFNFYIATFGDSKVEETGDWVQVMLETVPSFVISSSQSDDWALVCKGIVTSLHIDVMFANVGSLAVPQAKILGAVFRFGSPRDIVFACSSFRCTRETEEQHYDAVSSVSFVDATKPAIARFAEPPVYEVKLPFDFFYPFFSNSALLKPSNVLLFALFVFSCIKIIIH